MKVKELIKVLQGLDQEKDIWIFYDYPCSCQKPEFIEVSKGEANVFLREGCKEGDYAHWAW